MSWLHGNHALKVGVDIIAPMKNQFMDVPATRGSLRFRNAFTGNAMADYLLGYVADLQLSNVFVVEQRHRAQMFFVQDDWKVNSTAVAEPRAALRLHHAGARSQQRADQLQPGRQRAAWSSPRTARSRIAAW